MFGKSGRRDSNPRPSAWKATPTGTSGSENRLMQAVLAPHSSSIVPRLPASSCSSSRLCRCRGAARAQGPIGCSTSEEALVCHVAVDHELHADAAQESRQSLARPQDPSFVRQRHRPTSFHRTVHARVLGDRHAGCPDTVARLGWASPDRTSSLVSDTRLDAGPAIRGELRWGLRHRFTVMRTTRERVLTGLPWALVVIVSVARRVLRCARSERPMRLRLSVMRVELSGLSLSTR